MELLKKFYQSIKELNQNTQNTNDLINCSEFLLDKLKKKDIENSFKNDIIEFLKYFFTASSTVKLFNSHNELFTKTRDCILEQNKNYGIKLMRNFNGFIVTNLFKQSDNDDSGFTSDSIKFVVKNYFMDTFLDKVTKFCKQLKDSRSLQQSYGTSHSRQNQAKYQSFKDSIIIFDEIFFNLINLLEAIAKNSDKQFRKQKEIQDYIEKICQQYLKMMGLNFQQINDGFSKTNFKDFLQFILRALTFFGNILVRKKDKFFEKQQFILQLSQKIEQEASRNQNKNLFVNVVVKLMEQIPVNIAKFKEECFQNVKTFFCLYPKKMVDNIQILAMDNFFMNESKIYYDFDVIRSIYFSWISTIKTLIRNGSQIIIDQFTNNQYHAIFENLFSILFDDNIYFNYVLKVINYMSNLLGLIQKNEQLQKNDHVQKHPQFQIFLSNLMSKLVKYVKKTRKDIHLIIQCLKKIQQSEDKDIIIENLAKKSKDEIMQAFREKGDKILKQEMINKEDLNSRYDQDKLILNTVIVDFEKGGKLSDFIDEAIYKRLAFLNDLLLKAFQFYVKWKNQYTNKNQGQTQTEDEQKCNSHYEVLLEYPEEELLRKIFKENIIIMNLLITNVKIIEEKYSSSSIKDIQFKLYEFVYWKKQKSQFGTYEYYSIYYKQIHRIIQRNIDDLILTFKNVEEQHGQNHRDYFQIILESLGCQFYHVFPPNESREDFIIERSRYLNKAFFKVMINRIMELMSSDHIPFYHKLYQKNPHQQYLLTILKGIYRTIKYKIKVHEEQFCKSHSHSNYKSLLDKKNMYIMDVKKETIDLIFVLIQQVYKKKGVYNYLYILKIILNVAIKNGAFENEFSKFCIKYDFKLIRFFKFIFCSKYDEMKSIALDLLVDFQIDFKFFQLNKVEDISSIEWFFEMLIYSLDHKENILTMRSWNAFNQQMFKYFNKKQIQQIMNSKFRKLFTESLKINKTPDTFFSFLHQKFQIADYFFKARYVIKLISNYSEMINQTQHFTQFKLKNNSTENMEFIFEGEDKKEIFQRLNIGSFLDQIEQQLISIKKKPFYYNLNVNSKNYNYLYQNKTPISISLDKLFKFLNILMLTILNNDMEVADHLIWKIMTCLYLLCFFLRVFKISELTEPTTDELNKLKKIFELLQKNVQKKYLLMRFLIQNCFTYLQLSIEKTLNPLQDLSKQIIIKILKENEEQFARSFVELVIEQLNSNDYHVLEAIIDILYNEIIPNLNELKFVPTVLFSSRVVILLSIVKICNILDFNIKIELQEKVLSTFKSLSLFFFQQEKNSNNQQIVAFFSDIDRFQKKEIFQVRVEIIKEMAKLNEGKEIEQPNLKQHIINQASIYFRKIAYKDESYEKFWNVDFLNQQLRLISVIKYAFQEGLIQIKELKSFNEIKQIFEWIAIVCGDNNKFCEHARQKMTFLLVKKKLHEDEDLIPNQKLYYYNFDLNINVDQYDYIIKLFSILIKDLIEFCFEFFKKYAIKLEKEAKNNRELKDGLTKIYNQTSVILTRFYFRLENTITSAIFDQIRIFAKLIGRNDDNKLIKKIFIPLKLLGGDEQKTNNSVCKKINEPILNIYFNQLQNFQNHLEMNKVLEIMQNFSKLLKDDIKNKIKINEISLEDFQVTRKFYYILNWIRIQTDQRERIFEQLKEVLKLEIQLQDSQSVYSLYDILLQMINKQSNSLFYNYIFENIQKLYQNQEDNLKSFFLIYDIFKHEKSICMRERISREQIVDSIIKESTKTKEKTYWLSLLYPISKNSNYFFESKNFNYFSKQMFRIIEENKNKQDLFLVKDFFSQNNLFLKIMKNYLKINPFSKQMDIYLKQFLNQKNFSLREDIQCFIRPFEDEKSEDKFVEKVKRCILNKTDEILQQQANIFYLTEIAPRYLQYLSQKSIQALLDCQEYKKLFSKLKDQSVTNSVIVANIKFISLLYLKSDSNSTKNLIQIFPYTWNNIAYPKEGEERIKNVCILMVSTFMKKNPQEIREKFQSPRLKPLFETVLIATKIFDNDSKLIWLKSLHQILELYMEENTEWFKDVLGAYDFSELVYSSKRWIFAIDAKDLFKEKFFDLFKQKFFQDNFLQLNDSYDCLLIIANYIINNMDKSEVKNYLSEQVQNQIIQKLMNCYTKDIQESHTHEHQDKIFNLLLIYLKLFDNINLSFDLIQKYFLDVKSIKKSTEDIKTQKFSKLVIQNLTLIYYFLKKNIHHPQFESYSFQVLQYIPSHQAYTNPLTYIKYIKIPILIFNIMKLCFSKPQNLEKFQDQVNQKLKNYSRENKDMMIGVFFYHFALQNLNNFKQYRVIHIEHILDHVLNLIINDKKSYTNQNGSLQKHTAHGLFDLKDDLNIPEYSFIALYKFFATTLIKTLFLCYKHTITEQDFEYLKNLLKKISQDLSFDNIQIKQMVLNLVRSLLIPESPHQGYEIYSSDAFSQEQKRKMLLEIKITDKQLSKEYMNPHFRTYLNLHVNLVLKYLNQSQLNEIWNQFLVNDCIKAFAFLNSINKDNLIKRIGQSVNYDYLQLFSYILENWQQDRYSYFIYHMEGDVTLCVFVEIFCRVLKLKSANISLYYNGFEFIKNQLVYEKFLGVIEGKTYTTSFLFQTLKNYLKYLYDQANDNEKERFIVSMIHFLIGETQLIPFDQNQLIEILMDISDQFCNSDLIFKVLQLQDVNHRFIKKFEKIKNPTDKQIMFAQSLLNHTKSLFYDDVIYIGKQNSKMIKNFEKIEILSELRQYEKLKNLTQSIIKDRKETNNDIKEEMIDKFLQENWVSAKMNLGEWQDIHEIVNQTENYDLQVETLKNLGKIEEKFNLLQRKAQPKNKSMGIVDLYSYIIQKMDLFEDINEIKNQKQKDFLFLYNYLYQKSNDIESSDENLINVLDNHQISYEFQQGFDVFLHKSSNKNIQETIRMQEMKLINNEWRQKAPGINREPYIARKILNQRAFISESFYKMIKRMFNNQSSMNQNNNEKFILDNPLYDKLQILKIERKQNLPSTIDLSKIEWEPSKTKNRMINVVYKLYKEFSYANLQENVNIIKNVINNTYPNVLQLKFKLFDFKMLIKQNKLLDAYNIANQIQKISSVEHFNGKFYEQLFNFFYKYMTMSKIFPSKIMIDFYDAFGKSLCYDFNKNGRKNFYKFMIIHYLKSQYQSNQQQQKPAEQVNQMPTINESSQNKTEDQIIQFILSKLPMKVFKPFILEIFNYWLLDKEKKQQIIFKNIVQIWQSQDPIDSYYTVEKFKLLLKNKFFEDTEKIFKNLLPQKAISFQNLTTILNKYAFKTKIKQHMLIHKIIENFYINKAIEQQSIEELTNNEDKLKQKIAQISQTKKLSNMQKIHQVIIYLEKWLIENPPIKQTFIPEFLLYNQIYLIENSVNNIQVSHDYKRKQYILQPYFYCKSSNGTTSIEIKLIDEKNKIKSLLIKPLNMQRRKQKNKAIDNGIFMMYYKINEIMIEPFFKNNLTRDSFQKLPENFIVLDDDWYIVDKRKDISLLDIEKQGFKNIEDCHLYFKNKKEQNIETIIEQTFKIYPQDIFKNYLFENFVKQEQISLIQKRVAQSIAFDYFNRYIFGFETKFSDCLINSKTGLIYTDINSSFTVQDEQLMARLTPNIMNLLNQRVYRRKFLATIIALKNELQKDKNKIYMDYVGLILKNKNIEETIQDDPQNNTIQCQHYYKKLQEIQLDSLCTYMESIQDKKVIQKRYKLIDKPWF